MKNESPRTMSLIRQDSQLHMTAADPHTTAHLSVSLDGFVAGPDQSLEHPLGRGGFALHRWHIGDDRHEVDQRWSDRLMRPRGACLMGRNMFGPVRGSWSSWTGSAPQEGPASSPTGEWRGWWGEEPPYHAPVVVLTHHPREPLELTGTTFVFCTDGFAAGLAQARELGGGDVHIAGGASVVRQALAVGEVDELTLDIAPVLLGAGERVFEGLADLPLEVLEAEHSPLATHVRYRIAHPGR
jgi:dihydrofolate reductase